MPSIRAARAEDRPAIATLLTESALPLAGLPDPLDAFVVAEDETGIVGAMGLELFAPYALLRSAAVHPRQRGSGLGTRLAEATIALARSRQLTALYLLTTTAAEWFPRFGFRSITRAEVPPSVRASAEFVEACPASATVMHLLLHPQEERTAP